MRILRRYEFGLGLGLGSLGSTAATASSAPVPVFSAPLTSDLTDSYSNGAPTFTRATAANMDVEGILIPYASGEARIHPTHGLLMEGARENECLYSEDMSNAAWTKSNTQVNSTSTLDPYNNSSTVIEVEATATNGTILQTVTKASESNTFSVYLKRVSGTGTVEITIDGGSTWTAAAITSEWARFQRTQTLANPSFGVRITTSGDKIAMDCCQLEDDPVGPAAATSYIGPTTTAAVTRNLDQLTYAGNWDVLIPDTDGTLYCEVTPIHATTENANLVAFRSVTNSNFFYGSGSGTVIFADAGTNATQLHGRVAGALSKYATRWNSGGTKQVVVDGSAGTSQARSGAISRSPVDTIHVGWGDTTRSIWAYIKNVRGYDVDLGADQLEIDTAA